MNESELTKKAQQRARNMERSKRWYYANRDLILARQKKQYTQERYGLSREDYMMLMADAKCAICNKAARHLDHCHTSNRVREPLCMACNVLLGSAKEDSELLRRAATYLEKHSASPPVTDDEGKDSGIH